LAHPQGFRVVKNRVFRLISGKNIVPLAARNYSQLHLCMVNIFPCLFYSVPVVLHYKINKEVLMPTKNPRINVVLTPRIYADVQTLSEVRGLSLSSVVEDLIEDALEIQEDIALAALADERKKSLKKSELVSHKKAWS
jgi:hypothetical protein